MNGNSIANVVDISGATVTLNGTTSLALNAPLLTLPSLASGSAPNLLNYNASTKEVSYAAPFRPQYSYYVAKNGSDSNDGSYSRPWLTIQYAISAIEATESDDCAIYVAFGEYVENLTFTKGYISLISPLNTQDTNEICKITGNISVAIIAGLDNINANTILLQGFLVGGSVIDTSLSQHTLFLQDCYIYADNRALYQNSSVDVRTRLANVEIKQDGGGGYTDPMIEIARGDCYMERVDAESRENCSVFTVSGTGAISRAVLCAFEASSGTKPMVDIVSTRAGSFGNSSFISAGGARYAIAISSRASPIILSGNVFSVAGIAGNAIGNAGLVVNGGNNFVYGTASGYLSPALLLPMSTDSAVFSSSNIKMPSLTTSTTSTMLYWDATNGITKGGLPGVQTLTAGSNIALSGSSSNPTVNVAISSDLDMNGHALTDLLGDLTITAGTSNNIIIGGDAPPNEIQITGAATSIYSISGALQLIGQYDVPPENGTTIAMGGESETIRVQSGVGGEVYLRAGYENIPLDNPNSLRVNKSAVVVKGYSGNTVPAPPRLEFLDADVLGASPYITATGANIFIEASNVDISGTLRVPIVETSSIIASTMTMTGGVKIGELNYSDIGAIVAASTNNGFYQGFLCQNKSSGVGASANVVCVNDSAGTDYAAMGINSSGFSNLYNTLFEIPNATYMSGTLDTVIGSQSDHAVSSNACVYLTYNSGEGAYCINTQGALSLNASRPAGVLNKGSFGTAGQTLVSAGSNAPPSWTTPFRPTNMWYVAKNGNDTTGDGSYANPYSTIQKAIDIVEAQSDESHIGVITIAPGHYTEDLTFTKGYIALLGVNANTQDTNEICEVNGRILINITTGTDDKFNKQVILSNLQITEVVDSSTSLVYDTSTKQHTLFLQNSYLFGKGTLLHQNSSVDCVTRLTQVEVNQASSAGIVGPTLRFSVGQVYMERCDVDTNQDTNSMLVDGTGVISRCVLCSFENNYPTATAKSIVRIENNLLHTFGNCSFIATPSNWYALQTTGFTAPIFPAGFGTSGLNLVFNSILLSATGGAGGIAVNNTGYVYKQNNGSFFGSATGYSSAGLVYAYSAM